MDSKNNFKVIGLMSGTSLDGVDLACCTFKQSDGAWRYTIQAAKTVKYPPAWIRKLSGAHLLSGEELVNLDAAYGKYLGMLCA
ncbi:MAG TPA: anhydro-N-acetylmuramic acid kinase, partial [Ohtaekwangia sp.]|nr:anhydro-N-acetylmuramic acid kinase [Ohtaekwangia sp.]